MPKMSGRPTVTDAAHPHDRARLEEDVVHEHGEGERGEGQVQAPQPQHRQRQDRAHPGAHAGGYEQPQDRRAPVEPSASSPPRGRGTSTGTMRPVPRIPRAGTRLSASNDNTSALPIVYRLLPDITEPSTTTAATTTNPPTSVVRALATRGGRTRTTRPMARRTSGITRSTQEQHRHGQGLVDVGQTRWSGRTRSPWSRRCRGSWRRETSWAGCAGGRPRRRRSRRSRAG